jgi:hypothetical protein
VLLPTYDYGTYVRSLYHDDLLASPSRYTDLALRHLGDGSIRDNYVRPHYVLLPTYDYGTYVIFTRTSDQRVPHDVLLPTYYYRAMASGHSQAAIAKP